MELIMNYKYKDFEHYVKYDEATDEFRVYEPNSERCAGRFNKSILDARNLATMLTYECSRELAPFIRGLRELGEEYPIDVIRDVTEFVERCSYRTTSGNYIFYGREDGFGTYAEAEELQCALFELFGDELLGLLVYEDSDDMVIDIVLGLNFTDYTHPGTYEEFSDIMYDETGADMSLREFYDSMADYYRFKEKILCIYKWCDMNEGE